MMRKGLWFVAILAAMVALGGLLFAEQIRRASFALTLFSGAEQYQNFNRVAEVFPTDTMTAASQPHAFVSVRWTRLVS